tara:strand:+ start:613 stop:1203 length:591 start_codon:yes stop_codon:yes gene_type:complete
MKVNLIIPNKWEDITINTYQKYLKIQESKAKDKNKVIKSLSLLCNTSEDIVKKMAYKDLVDIMGIVSELIDSEPDSTSFKKIFKLDNDEYGFIPNMSKLTTGEYIDLESYCKEPIENLHIIMSILYRKITFKRNEKYAIEPYDPDKFKEELFKDCPMDVALSSLGFFLTLGERLARISHNYLKKQKKKKMPKSQVL